MCVCVCVLLSLFTVATTQGPLKRCDRCEVASPPPRCRGVCVCVCVYVCVCVCVFFFSMCVGWGVCGGMCVCVCVYIISLYLWAWVCMCGSWEYVCVCHGLSRRVFVCVMSACGCVCVFLCGVVY